MRPDPRVLLADVDRAASDITRFTEGMDRETYVRDARTIRQTSARFCAASKPEAAPGRGGAAEPAERAPDETGRMRGAVVILAIAIVVYFSPYLSCIWNTDARAVDDPALRCAVAFGGRR